jgi:hypothetical protein
MEALVLIAVLVASVLVVASGVWVAVALFGAIRRVERPARLPGDGTLDENRE